MEIKILLEELFQKFRLGIKPGLERTFALTEHLGNPQNDFKTVHIAGTNGKGATSSLIASFLQETGFKVGLYTSPHFFKFNERIRINGKQISDEEIISIYREMAETAEEIKATFFEITTIMAFVHFAKNNVDFAVIETGMGGRFDSTNIISPELSIITSIGMDHSEFLGDSIEKIAFEKAGIIKQETPIIYASSIPKSAQEVICNQAKKFNSKSIKINKFDALNYNSDFTSEVMIDDRNYNFPISGEMQLSNLALAIEALKILNIKPKIQKSFENLYKNTGYFGRLQALQRKPLILIDIAHNEEAIENSINTIKKHNPKVKFHTIFTCMKEKNYKIILNKLNDISEEIIITKTKNPRNIDPNLLIKYCQKSEIIHSYIESPNLAFKHLSIHRKNTLIIGSFFLIAELENEIKKFRF